MQQLARPGAIFMTAQVARLAEGHVEVTELGEKAVKGLADPVRVYELTGATGARSRMEIEAARGLTRFVGLEAVMAMLAEAVERAGEGRGQGGGIVGEPGVGKSRVLWELLHSPRLRGWQVLRADATAIGARVPYLPVVELLRAVLGIAPGDDAAAIGERARRALTAVEAEQFLSPLLALLDAPPGDERWAALDSGQRRRRTVEAVKYLVIRGAREAPLCLAV